MTSAGQGPRILVVGSGGREHALVWKLRQSPLAGQVFAAPGNPGTAGLAVNVPIGAEAIADLLAFARAERIDLTVVGPEAPLAAGIVDAFQDAGLSICGPTRAAAELEASKSFAKDFMHRHGIPTAAYRTFDALEPAVAHVREAVYPLVVKADGLAAGKGVAVCPTATEAETALVEIMGRRVHGDAGRRVVIEECLAGQEVSVLALTDGVDFLTLPAAQDHKAVFDGDRGPNTGGMGAYAPTPVLSPEQLEVVRETIIRPTLIGLREEGRRYRGVLYAGLMLTAQGPKVLEFNCRFGDPETQVVLPLLETDLFELLREAASGSLAGRQAVCSARHAVCVVVAAAGYPGPYQRGLPITRLPEDGEDLIVFHAGTSRGPGGLETAGGRVVGVTALGDTLAKAIARAYAGAREVRFEGAYYRTDIGARALLVGSGG